MKTRLVLDTNAWLDWLVFGDACMTEIRRAVDDAQAEVWIDAACEAEFARVLAYPLGRHALDAARQAECRAQCLALSRRWESLAAPAPRLPKCRDPDDQKFLVLAAACDAAALITKDAALLELARRVPFRIVTPAEFAKV
ncbi:MAG: putative toxin-antitoxin system toxin component, PIN family [Betaproteobacteria bacterium]|nr:putative toxin-antitoxin system toxin component, PIN family [Betaproteobacteria bacterium]